MQREHSDKSTMIELSRWEAHWPSRGGKMLVATGLRSRQGQALSDLYLLTFVPARDSVGTVGSVDNLSSRLANARIAKRSCHGQICARAYLMRCASQHSALELFSRNKAGVTGTEYAVRLQFSRAIHAK